MRKAAGKQAKKTVMITGAGSGFGKSAAFDLARLGYHVVATVEIMAQKSVLEEEVKRAGLDIVVEKVDITDPADYPRGWHHNVDILVNNAGISEGGSMLDIPRANLERQFAVNVIGPILFTQGIARKMVKRKAGKIVFVSSVAGITTDPFAGAYSASKHAVEAVAEALNKEVRAFGIDVATVNPGPYLTGFNDRMFETWRTWVDDPGERVFDYAKIAFPHEQYDPQIAVNVIVDVVTGKSDAYRNVTPVAQIEPNKKMQAEVWTRKIHSAAKETGQDDLVKKAHRIKPGTPVDKNPKK